MSTAYDRTWKDMRRKTGSSDQTKVDWNKADIGQAVCFYVAVCATILSLQSSWRADESCWQAAIRLERWSGDPQVIKLRRGRGLLHNALNMPHSEPC
jgi:hypothetical protein